MADAGWEDLDGVHDEEHVTHAHGDSGEHVQYHDEHSGEGVIVLSDRVHEVEEEVDDSSVDAEFPNEVQPQHIQANPG